MFATVLIKNIGNLYICDHKFTILHHAYIAIHHDIIVDVGECDYHKWIDSSTHVIDAASRAVIPAFIEPAFSINKNMDWDDRRKIEEKLNILSRNGTLTICTNQDITSYSKLLLDVINVHKFAPTIYNKYLRKFNRKYLISCQESIVSQHAMGAILHFSYKESAKNLLKAMTCNVAKTYKLDDRGSIKKGKKADLLVLYDTDIESFFSTLGKPLYSRIIKKGIPIYPYMQRV